MKSTNDREEKIDKIFHVASGTQIRISKCFQRSKQKLHIIFLFKMAAVPRRLFFAALQLIAIA
jgi:hypothetical protein